MSPVQELLDEGRDLYEVALCPPVVVEHDMVAHALLLQTTEA